MSYYSTARCALRRAIWILNQLFWEQLVSPIAGNVTRMGVLTIRSRIVRTPSPLLMSTLLTERTVDGAILSGNSDESWAKFTLKKGLPIDGGKRLAIENEEHTLSGFSGEIPSGYGKGVKTMLYEDNTILKVDGKTSVQRMEYHEHQADRAGHHYDLVVSGVKPKCQQFEINVVRGPCKGRYAFVTTAKGILVTSMVDNGIRIPKPDYTLRKEDLLTEIDPARVIIERKIDGSLGNAAIKDYRVMFRSHRESAETYYDKLPALEFIDNKSKFFTSRLLYPGPSLDKTVFRGELSHPEGSARVSGILNSLAPNARVIQKQRGPVKFFVWDIVRYKGRDVSSLPYSERRALYKRLVAEIRQVNKCWDVVEEMPKGMTPKEFYEHIISDPLPMGEGVVIKPIDSALPKWDKIKLTGFGYFKLAGVLPGEGKYAGTVGRLLVENPENGATGEVGSLSVPDDFRKWMWENKEDLIGQTVKVRSQEITQRGVPRAGTFIGFHNGEIDLLMAAEANAAGTNRTSKEVMYAMKSATGWRRK